MNHPKRKFSRFQIVEPDCKCQIDNVEIRVYNLYTKPKVEYNLPKNEVPDSIKTAVKIWVKHLKYGGLSLEDYMDSLFDEYD